MDSAPQSISPEELKTRLFAGEDVLVVDVRQPEEYADWKITPSINIPLFELNDSLDRLPKTKEIIAVCAHGNRSERARQFLAALGYKARNVAGGMVAWNSVYDAVEIVDSFEDKAIQAMQFRRIGKGCLSYMLASGKDAIVIDPGLDVHVYIDSARMKNVNIVAVLDTHTHADHISGGRELANFAGCPYYSPDKAIAIDHKLIQPDTQLTFGGVQVKIIPTPGHTPESVTYLAGNLVFTGDTLFVESVGRPDLGQDPSSNAPTLWESVHNIISLPQNAMVFPAHYGNSVPIIPHSAISASIAELSSNPALMKSREGFVDWIMATSRPKPANFEIIKKINQGLIPVPFQEDWRELEAGSNRCSV